MLRVTLAAFAFGLFAVRAEAAAVVPLADPVMLNIGITCQWQQSCQRRQVRAMKDARAYVARAKPPLWRIHTCNRNARRGPGRVDWVGFNKCIRNNKLRRSARR